MHETLQGQNYFTDSNFVQMLKGIYHPIIRYSVVDVGPVNKEILRQTAKMSQTEIDYTKLT